jgi:hypothetical protein
MCDAVKSTQGESDNFVYLTALTTVAKVNRPCYYEFARNISNNDAEVGPWRLVLLT